jgi:hypothetical protein
MDTKVLRLYVFWVAEHEKNAYIGTLALIFGGGEHFSLFITNNINLHDTKIYLQTFLS